MKSITPEDFAAAHTVLAEALANIPPPAGKRCSACLAVAMLWYGGHRKKFAVNGSLNHCPYCWSVDWFDTEAQAWAWFDRVQGEYEVDNPKPALELKEEPF